MRRLGALAAAITVVFSLAACGPFQSPHKKTPVTQPKTPAKPLTVAVTTLPSLPQPRAGVAGAALSGQVWLAGGVGSADTSQTSLWVYNPASGVQSSFLLPIKTHDAALTPDGPDLLVVGGGQALPLNSYLKIHPATGKIDNLGAIPVALSDLWAGEFAGVPTMIGGYDGHHAQSAVWRLNLSTGKWQVWIHLPYGVRYPAVAIQGGNLFVMGGLTDAGSTSRILEISPSGGIKAAGNLPVALHRAAAGVLGGAVYVFGGYDGQSYFSTIYRIDPVTGRVSLAGHLPQAWSYGAVASTGGSVLLLGGENAQGALSTVWKVTLTGGH